MPAHGDLDPDRIRSLHAEELTRFRGDRPRTMALLERARAHMPNGVPMAWMVTDNDQPIDPESLAAALAPEDVALVLTEPAMTNGVHLLLPEPGWHDALRSQTRKAGTLLVLDETHTHVVGERGATGLWGLDPDMVTIGKAVAGGIPMGAYGVSAALAPELDADRNLATGGTLFGNALSAAAAKAALTEVLVPEAYAHAAGLGEALADGIEAAIDEVGLPWIRIRFGPRSGQWYGPQPRTGADALALTDLDLTPPAPDLDGEPRHLGNPPRHRAHRPDPRDPGRCRSLPRGLPRSARRAHPLRHTAHHDPAAHDRPHPRVRHPREVGLQMGEAARGTIRDEVVSAWNDLPAGRSKADQLALAATYRDVTAPALPWLMEELDACAEAAGVDALEFFACSIEEIWYEPRVRVTQGRCSDLVAGPAATADGHLLVAHTNDLGPSAEPRIVALEKRVTGDPVVFQLGGIPILSVGFNSAGMALTGNELTPNHRDPGARGQARTDVYVRGCLRHAFEVMGDRTMVSHRRVDVAEIPALMSTAASFVAQIPLVVSSLYPKSG